MSPIIDEGGQSGGGGTTGTIVVTGKAGARQLTGSTAQIAGAGAASIALTARGLAGSLIGLGMAVTK
jgi:hypothetical protein